VQHDASFSRTHDTTLNAGTVYHDSGATRAGLSSCAFAAASFILKWKFGGASPHSCGNVMSKKLVMRLNTE
jgi:hypothetical protein